MGLHILYFMSRYLPVCASLRFICVFCQPLVVAFAAVSQSVKVKVLYLISLNSFSPFLVFVFFFCLAF